MMVFDGYVWNVFGRIFADVRNRARQKGWLSALKFLPSRCLWSDVVHYEKLKIFKQAIPSMLIQSEVNGITYRLATPDDIPHYDQIFKHPSNINDHSRMLKSGDLTMLALDGDNLVGLVLGSIWQDGVRPTETDFVIINRAYGVTSEKDALIHRLYVTPDDEGRGIGSQLLAHLQDALAKKGVSTTYSAVNTDTPAAINVFTKKYGENIAEVTSIQFLNLQIINFSDTNTDGIK